MAQQSAFDLLSLDDFDFSALFNEQQHETLPVISDEEYAQHLQLQETLISSLIASQNPSVLGLPSSSVSSSSSSSSSCPSSSLTVIEPSPHPATEQVESSVIICEICAETKGSTQMFKNQSCHHSFCSDCLTKQVSTKIQDSITVVSCPGLDCKGVLELDACRPMLPKELLERWDQALCEALFLAAPKFYCPFKDCSAMMLVEDGEDGGAISQSECPDCHRLFCARCYVPWHPGVECEEFQILNEDDRKTEDLLVRELANEKKWRRCPQCNFFVEKIDGCLHITCRCKFEFCYRCGEQWSSYHGACQTN